MIDGCRCCSRRPGGGHASAEHAGKRMRSGRPATEQGGMVMEWNKTVSRRGTEKAPPRWCMRQEEETKNRVGWSEGGRLTQPLRGRGRPAARSCRAWAATGGRPARARVRVARHRGRWRVLQASVGAASLVVPPDGVPHKLPDFGLPVQGREGGRQRRGFRRGALSVWWGYPGAAQVARAGPHSLWLQPRGPWPRTASRRRVPPSP